MNFLYYKSLAIQGFIGVTREGRVYIVIFDSVNASGSAGVVCGGAEDMSVVGTVYVAESSSVKECTAVPFSVYFKETDIDSVKIDVLSTKIISIVDRVISSITARATTAESIQTSSFYDQMYLSRMSINADTFISVIINYSQMYSNYIDMSVVQSEDIYVYGGSGYSGTINIINYSPQQISVVGMVSASGSIFIDDQYAELISIVGLTTLNCSITLISGLANNIFSFEYVFVVNGVTFKLARPSILADFANDTLSQLSDKTLYDMFVIIS